ncbi:hypothetical protein [Polyangium spumosum]|uniref:Uncharacterized protein n=1 Tax=Polyangium spumosum TaxID=889282 RepID=A0A6N7Q2D0_9BACT|nr:hypothetical protein [Polyangium spumosum]MRG98189.1 hypothetical protein [Polyangium spumosum]
MDEVNVPAADQLDPTGIEERRKDFHEADAGLRSDLCASLTIRNDSECVDHGIHGAAGVVGRHHGLDELEKQFQGRGEFPVLSGR